MDLSLSHNDPSNTELLRPDGRALYSISTPARVSGETTKILKYTLDDASAEGSMQEIARINWHYVRTTRILFNGESLEVKKFMPRTGMLKQSRTFEGPDGRKYKWKTNCASVLEVDGPEPTVIARYHQGNVWKGKKPWLEIRDASMLWMLDLIVTTWVYIEKNMMNQEGIGTAAAR